MAKETVVRRPGAGWSFTIPYKHEVVVDEANGTVVLRTPMQGTTYSLAGVTDEGDERIVLLGRELGRNGPPNMSPPIGYVLPEIQDEFNRLRTRWDQAGLDRQVFDAYAPGSGHEDQLRMIRRRLREVDKQ
jgi:hypothetical protein